MRFSPLIIPPWHLPALAKAEGLTRPLHPRMNLWPNDAELQRCVSILTTSRSVEDAVEAEDRVDPARSLLLRLAELMGGGPSNERNDACVFTHRVLGQLVAHIDAHLTHAPSTDDMAALCGLSPNHFARKFHRSTGVSLLRFVNRRRLQASLGLLERGALAAYADLLRSWTLI